VRPTTVDLVLAGGRRVVVGRGFDPELHAYLVDVLKKLASGWSQLRLDELLPEHWTPAPAEPDPEAQLVN
jgi:hypothetical protein